jgi:anti-sigma regulatory factor (Ser/Thr protein kinase)
MQNEFFISTSPLSLADSPNDINRSDVENAPVAVVHLQRFLQATRDAGYKNVEAALSELVDNSLQAEASRVEIALRENTNDLSGQNYQILIWDNGCGMSRSDLEAALQFGGSSRFNDRDGMGRYGMGLPNSSLSQARRVDIWSWRVGIRGERRIYHVRLDLDQLLDSDTPYILSPRTCSSDEITEVLRRHRFEVPRSPHGTLIVWSRIDRISPGTWAVLPKRLHARIGQRFRYFLWDGRMLRCNGKEIVPFDPLYLNAHSLMANIKASEFIAPLRVPVRTMSGESADVEIQFSLLPIAQTADWPTKDKKAVGIIGGSGVSIVRAGREIDYGWFFFDKRRENYDDWWRCEIKFPPVLDEVFGVTHTKQGIRPSEELRVLLTHEISGTARELNRVVQTEHQRCAQYRATQATANIASQRDMLLKPLFKQQQDFVGEDASPNSNVDAKNNTTSLQYEFKLDSLESTEFVDLSHQEGKLIIRLNLHHEFYLQIWKPLSEREPRLAHAMELCLLGLARAWAGAKSSDIEQKFDVLLSDWSRAMSVFLRGLH